MVRMILSSDGGLSGLSQADTLTTLTTMLG